MSYMNDRDDFQSIKKYNYLRVYNLLMLVIVNIDFNKLKVDGPSKVLVSEIHDLINAIADKILNGTFEQYFEKLYLFESGDLNEQLLKEVFDEFQATDD